MNDTMLTYAAVQNGVILDVYSSHEEAYARVKDEIRKDWLEILVKKKLRTLLKKSGSVALHKYQVIKIIGVEDVKE